MSSDKLASLRAAFGKKEEGGQNYSSDRYPFWNMKTGETATVRFLPDKDETNPLGFLVEKFTHRLNVNGDRQIVPCLKTYEEDCPICNLSQSYYRKEDKANGKKYWRSKQHIAQVIVIKDPLPANEETGETHEGKLRTMTLSWQLFEVIKEAFESGDLDEVPYDFEEGCDFIIKKTQQGEYASYSVGSKFARKTRALTEEEVALFEEKGVELKTLLAKNPGEEYVSAVLQAELNGTAMPKKDGGKSDSDAVSAVKTALKANSDDSDDDDDDDSDDFDDMTADDILKSIRARSS